MKRAIVLIGLALLPLGPAPAGAVSGWVEAHGGWNRPWGDFDLGAGPGYHGGVSIAAILDRRSAVGVDVSEHVFAGETTYPLGSWLAVSTRARIFEAMLFTRGRLMDRPERIVPYLEVGLGIDRIRGEGALTSIFSTASFKGTETHAAALAGLGLAAPLGSRCRVGVHARAHVMFVGSPATFMTAAVTLASRPQRPS